jgi:hydrogenase maturation factor
MKKTMENDVFKNRDKRNREEVAKCIKAFNQAAAKAAKKPRLGEACGHKTRQFMKYGDTNVLEIPYS